MDNDRRGFAKTSVGYSEDVLRRALLERRGSRVTNPRDIVYGHLGLLDPEAEPPVDIDYDKSICHVFEDITKHFIERDHSLDILRHIDRANPDVHQYGLPSWVPDWSARAKNKVPDLKSSKIIIKNYTFPLSIPHIMILEGSYRGRIKHIIKDCSSFNTHGYSCRNCYSVSNYVPIGPDLDHNYKVNGYLTASLSDSPWQETIKRTKSKEIPETMLDIFRNMCIEFCKEIEMHVLDSSLKGCHGNDDLKPTIGQLFQIPVEGIMYDRSLVPKLASILNYMYTFMYGMSEKNFAILDSGELVCVTKEARANDIACRLDSDPDHDCVCILRHTDSQESRYYEHLLAESIEIEEDPQEAIKVYKMVSFGNKFCGFLRHLHKETIHDVRVALC